MAIYHCCVKVISRSAGRSSVGAAAYRAGEKLHHTAVEAAAYRSGGELRDNVKTHDYTKKKDVTYSEIILPAHAPREFHDRGILWNSVENAERQHNAQTAREIVLALPNKLSLSQQIKLTQDYVQENFVSAGMCADFSIHLGHKHVDNTEINPDAPIKKNNPHAHIMLTMRPLDVGGAWCAKSKKEYILDKNGNRIKLKSGAWKSTKVRATNWDEKESLLKWRENWANIVNKEFERLGIDERIDHRTLKAQGIDREPTIHEGRNPEKIKYNQEVRRRNREREQKVVAGRLDKMIKTYGDLEQKIAAVKTEKAEKNQEIQYISARIERIEKYTENITIQDTKLDELRTERQSMGILRSKKDIDKQIAQQEEKCQSVRNIFKHYCKIEPEKASAELARLGAELEAWQRRTIPDLVPLIDFHKEIEHEYKRVHLAIESRPDRQEVFAHMERLKRAESVKKQVEYTRIERTLKPPRERISDPERSR